MRSVALLRALPWALSWALCGPVQAQPRFDFDATRTVLPKTVLPSHYALSLRVDPQREQFDGRATIQVRARERVPSITVHARYLDVQRVRLVTGTRQRNLRVTPDEGTATLKLVPTDGRPIAAGAHRLVIDYRGRIDRTGNGLYRADHRADHRADGRPASMLATQLQATNARMLFPGWDEPLFRARFDIEVTAPDGYEVLSNQPQVRRDKVGADVRHRFATTPPMPTYLVALAVGRFDVLEGRAGRVPLRIFTAPGKRELARNAMAVTQQLLPYYERYFGTPYALPKLDQIAVPGVRDGAMEDWGLISYIEDGLLFDPERSGIRTERQAFAFIAHELAHQWFGNLVSVALWDEIWLNEAFATWMEDKAAARFRPEWQTRLAARGWLDGTLGRDAGKATRAIRSGPVDEASVFDVFDGITYSKGGAVLSMLEQWIGEDAFQRGLAAYMKARRMAPATAGDLWHHIGRAAGKPVARVAAGWTDQVGFPLIDVSTACENGRTRVTLAQQRFTSSASVPTDGAWQVPVQVAQGSALRTWLLDGPQARFELPGCDAAPMVVNAGGHGFYRVRYSDELQRRLQRGFGAMAAADRVMLVSDSFALALTGRQTLAQHFDWLAQLPRVEGAGRAPLFALATQQLARLDNTLHGSVAQAPLRAAARALLAPELARLGWSETEGEDPEARRLRGQLVDALAQFGDAEVIARAREFWPAAIAPDRRAGAVRVPRSLHGAILTAVASDMRADEAAALWSLLRATDRHEERRTYLRALSSDPDPARAQRLLEASVEGWLPSDQAIDVPYYLGSNPVHAAQAYAFTVARWQDLARLTGDDVFGGRSGLLPGAAGGLNERAAAERLRADQLRLAGPTGAMPAATAAEAIEARAALVEREAQRLAQALAAWSPAP